MKSTQVFGYSDRLRLCLTLNNAKVSYTLWQRRSGRTSEDYTIFDEIGIRLQIFMKLNFFLLILDH